ncbi:MAG: aminotransferase class V-fold PLP-dependent enzyme, partial [Candidatus Eisenbacteria bacterium]|nr:aminotransferase class V-fold PLP-dependent enzyme [Candidatus Eisenbacteria bacterium]
MMRVYLDHNATTPVHADVFAAMEPFLRERFGNASSVHSFGRPAREAVERARAQVAALIGAREREIVFTSGGTEADNLALRGTLDRLAEGGRRPHIVTSAIEHPAVLNVCQFLEKRGDAVTFVSVDEDGRVDPRRVAEAIRPDTGLVSIMLANNEVGTIEPIREIAALARERDVLVHTDAVQAAGRLPIDVAELGVDLLSLSAHKIYGPKGVGALFVRRGVKLTTQIFGGHQERGIRPGTENVAGIVGFGQAAELARRDLTQIAARESELRDRLEGAVLERIPHVRINGDHERRLPNTLNVGVAFLEGESMLMNLDLEGIACSTGSACSSGTL